MRFAADFRIFGHRGAAGSAPENTLPGFEHALQLGAAWVELDVQAHPEGLLIIHDDTLQRTTNGRGRVLTTPLAVLRRLDAGNGAHIPLLEEVLTRFRGRLALNVELKAGAGVGTRTAAALRHAVADGWEPAQLLVSSFDHAELQAFHAEAPEFPVAPLFSRTARHAIRVAQRFATDTVHVSVRAAGRGELQRLRAAGVRVHVYTVNSVAEAERLAGDGANGIFTDHPEHFVQPRS